MLFRKYYIKIPFYEPSQPTLNDKGCRPCAQVSNEAQDHLQLCRSTEVTEVHRTYTILSMNTAHLIPDEALEGVLVTQLVHGPVLEVEGELLAGPHPLQVQQDHPSVDALQGAGLPDQALRMGFPDREKVN